MLLITDLLKQIHIEKDIINNYKSSHIRFSEKDFKPVVVWNVNEHCNMSCPHCYASAKLIKKETKELSTEEAKTIIKELYNYGIKILIFSGGEPLLRRDIFDLLVFANNLGFYCHLSTNGVLITENIAKKLKEGNISYVGISIDGLSSFNDAYRGYKRGFEKSLSAIRYLKKYNIKTGIRITLSKANIDQLFPLIDIAIKEGVDRFYISHLLYSGRGETIQKDDLSLEESKKIMWDIFYFADSMIKQNQSIQFVSGGNDVDGAFLYLYVEKNYGEKKAQKIKNLLEKRKGNTAGEKIINIDHLGNVHPDQFWRNYTAGNILKNSLKEIMEDSLFLQLKQRELYLTECKECRFLMICRGSHRERAIAVYNDVWAMDPACYLSNEEKFIKKNLKINT